MPPHVEDRVYTIHASLGPLEWPAVTVDGVRYPGSSELAALHSRALGVPPERHIEVRRTHELEGERVPYDLLTYIAERGDWPWKGVLPCRSDWKTGLIYGAFSSMVRARKKVGIPSTSKARNGAWLAMVGAVHWKMLADLLGLADGTAHNWHKLNGETAPVTSPAASEQPKYPRARNSSPLQGAGRARKPAASNTEVVNETGRFWGTSLIQVSRLSIQAVPL